MPVRYPVNGKYLDCAYNVYKLAFNLPPIPPNTTLKKIGIAIGMLAAVSCLYHNGVNDAHSFGMLLCRACRSILGA